MNRNVRRIHAPAFKAQVALEAIKETKTVAELSSLYKIHATQITKWKHEAIELITGGFSTQHKQRKRHTEALIPELYRQIGRLKVEVDFLKKKMGLFEE
ncbi:hypothetical protein A3B56_03305 [Candidatus Roizmanbacteria bacterium RIFCSPLOWO2_01_FULL_45_11]|uniref:Transposase n=1 Tax=Candidatus Roizmanbacteria bacterium RIFCSPLOWO2_01_FULL_45_11 TaxID=1802070 RepID=A0A1F7JJH9_9BACT|nr:MAG: hypothetical protein A3B56_03305 [Candidatus Roizmanbacteria bacterium RIFCSPLOWO2_01_FULL_45_11]